MKKLLLSAVAACMVLASCNQSAKTADVADSASSKSTVSAATPTAIANPPGMKFKYVTHDFGKLPQGDKVTYKFNFINNGKSPLIIADAHASCGCTIPVWPKAPIKPGDSGQIVVTFSSIGKIGLQDKMVTIIANTNPPQNVVHLVGEVISKK
jgi:hypothetical protein